MNPANVLVEAVAAKVARGEVDQGTIAVPGAAVSIDRLPVDRHDVLTGDQSTSD